MDKKTILAIVLTVIVITISMFIQSYFFAPEYPDSAASAESEMNSEDTEGSSTDVSAQDRLAIVASSKNTSSEPFTYETDFYTITFDPAGASISSMVMKNHANADGEHVDLVFRGENDNNAFLMYWGDDRSNPITDNFAYAVDGKKVIFTNDYVNANGQKFTIIKTYEFKDGEYLFAVIIDIKGDGNFTGLVNNGYAYTLAYEPQVGPAFSQMKNNGYDYRRVYLDVFKRNGKLKKTTAKFSGGVYTTTDAVQWISVASKYFTVVALPQSNVSYKYTAVQGSTDDVLQTDSIYLSRPATGTSTSDTIYFYAGPQLKSYLGSYYSGMDNAWGLKNTDLDDAMDSSSWLGWLENILKWMLNILYKVIPNYGVGIILLTIILKIILWPLTKKGTDSTAKMTALQPQVTELQEKYKDNPQKLNVAMAELYRENGVSPMGGCLPMLLQFPILIAFYGLLNKHFELRGAMFIPGWIFDLSAPETIFTLGFNLPFLGNEIHLLPILYTASMILSMRMTSNTGSQNGQGQGTMKFMTYGMPILFFFILYSAPSGLLLYWFVSNVLTMASQMYTNKKIKNKPVVVNTEKKEPEAVRKYQEKLKRLEEEKAKAEKAAAKNKKK